MATSKGYIYALVRSTAPTAHGDPGTTNTGNTSPFRNRGLLLHKDGVGGGDFNAERNSVENIERAVAAFARFFPIPFDIEAPLYDTLSQQDAADFVASAFLFSLIVRMRGLNAGQGEGLFSGVDRYNKLVSRLGLVAGMHPDSLSSYLADLLNALQIEDGLFHAGEQVLLYLFALPIKFQQQVIARLGKKAAALVHGTARTWAEIMLEYWRERDLPRFAFDEQVAALAVAYYDPTGHVQEISHTEIVTKAVHISENSLRHQLRDTLRNHLLQELGYAPPDNQAIPELLMGSPIPIWFGMALSNGGNVGKGATTPPNSAAIEYAFRRTFPAMDALGGSLPNFIMSKSNFSMFNFVLCRQNNPVTRRFADGHFVSDIDSNALIDPTVFVRGVETGAERSKENGQMIAGADMLIAGSQMLITFSFAPNTSDLTRGSIYFAFERWLTIEGGQVGGYVQRGAGGHFQLIEQGVEPDCIWAGDSPHELSQLYQAYVQSNADKLRAAIGNGTFGYREQLVKQQQPVTTIPTKGKGKVTPASIPTLLPL